MSVGTFKKLRAAGVLTLLLLIAYVIYLLTFGGTPEVTP